MNRFLPSVFIVTIVLLSCLISVSCEDSFLNGRDETNSSSYKPVVIIHGIMDKKHSLEHLQEQIQQVRQTFFEAKNSLKPMK